MTLAQKLVKVREGLRPIKKNAQGHNYKYVDEEQVLNAVVKGLNENNVDVSMSILTEGSCALLIQPIEVPTKTGSRTAFWVSGVMEITFTDADNVDDKQVNKFPFAGMQDDPAQAVGSAATYANRYFLLKKFLIPTTKDDPDYAAQRGNNAPKKPSDSNAAPSEAAIEKAMGQVVTLKDDDGKLVKKSLRDMPSNMLQKVIDMPAAPAVLKMAAQTLLASKEEVING